MKYKLSVIVLLAGLSSLAQNKLRVLPQTPTFGNAKATFNTAAFSRNLMDSMKSDRTLIVYNPVTGLTDAYSKDGFQSKYNNAALLSENLLRGVKIDSFNPNGATDFEGALGNGLLNLLFNGNRGSSIYLP